MPSCLPIDARTSSLTSVPPITTILPSLYVSNQFSPQRKSDNPRSFNSSSSSPLLLALDRIYVILSGKTFMIASSSSDNSSIDNISLCRPEDTSQIILCLLNLKLKHFYFVLLCLVHIRNFILLFH